MKRLCFISVRVWAILRFFFKKKGLWEKKKNISQNLLQYAKFVRITMFS